MTSSLVLDAVQWTDVKTITLRAHPLLMPPAAREGPHRRVRTPLERKCLNSTEVGDREHLALVARAVELRTLRGTYEAHMDDHWSS
jgi:hypothetical protein